ncbi:MAG: hypothetical protein KDD69_06810 [Bdellovibrionales bacterium]|nr:hypothetical protein [Bdellovibrionales bacterium]
MDGDNLEDVLLYVRDVLGPYAEKVVIGGGIALLIYREYLAGAQHALPRAAATKDLDLVVERSLVELEEPLSARLKRAGFERETHSLDTPPVESYIASFPGEEIALEFLTDRKTRARSNRNVVVAGVSAQPLSYVEMSQSETVAVEIRGEPMKVVSAPAWIFHKALTFVKRVSAEKQSKDLYGIWYAGSQLGVFSEQSLVELETLANARPSRWRKTARKQLDEWIKEASPADWERLEAQDPARNLTRLRFRQFVEESFIPRLM